jgi:hypothetical protein
VTTRWTFQDTATGETYTVPINPNAMSPLGKRGTLKRTRGIYGVVTTRQVPSQVEYSFGGVIRSQDHYDALLTWVAKTVPVIITDHLGRRCRVYLTSFEPQDRSVTPKAPTRWTYTVKGTLLGGPL